MTVNLRAGVVGLKFGLRYVDAFYENAKTELVAVCDVNEVRLSNTVEKYNVRGYTDYDKMLNEADLDIVGIATPHNLHAPMSMDAMNAGINVLCVKPIATTIRNANRIIQTAKDTGMVYNTGYSLRHSPEGQKMKELLDDGAIGYVFHASSYIRAPRGPAYFFNCWDSWRSKAECGGQLVINQAIHHIDLFISLFGEATQVQGWIGGLNLPRHLPIEVEDTAFYLVEFKNGVIATFDNSIGIASAKTPGWNVEIYGERGTISFPYSTTSNMGILRSNFGADGWHYESDLELVDATGPRYGEVDVFLSAVLEGKNPGVTAEEGKKGLEVVIACYKSHSLGGERVKLPLENDDFSIRDALERDRPTHAYAEINDS